MTTLLNKRILLGISGGVAAYKSAELARRMKAAGADVRAVLTRAGAEFITPLTLQALTGRPVHASLLDPQAEAAMGHIELARWAEAVVIAPATANLLAKLAHGLADDLLSTLCLVTEAPMLVVPAMNASMWRHPATRANCEALAARGVRVLEPGSGDLACGESGPGRMREPDEIKAAVEGLFRAGPLAGRVVLVTAGPTREPIDPVRFVGNRSSGKMGFALAEAAAEAGAAVRLVAGPVSLTTPRGVQRIDVETAAEMRTAVLGALDGVDVMVAAAAVADYRPAQAAGQKIKKSAEALALTLERTADILGEVATRPDRPFLVGFAAETERLEEHARAKLQSKRLDMIAANRVGAPGQGFEADDNELQVFWPGGERRLPRADKRLLARQLMDLIAERHRAAQDPAQDP